MSCNTLFIRLEGPMQSWGVAESKFVVRRTAEAPTKSGVIGLLCAALGVTRPDAGPWLTKLDELRMGVRVDRAGVRWWDYHTVGAGMQMRIAEAENKTKEGAMLTRREYLCDASFLICMQGEPALIAELAGALRQPKWGLYLGRKSCPMSVPVVRGDQSDMGEYGDLMSALAAVAYRPRYAGEELPEQLKCFLDWIATDGEHEVPHDAEVWYDVPHCLEPPAHGPRFVVQRSLGVGATGELIVGAAMQSKTPPPPRPRADYTNTEYRHRREERLTQDEHLCVFCKSPATTVQHITYRHAGGDERIEELRALCRLCHDAVTMIEYGLGMGLDRINPEDPEFRERIIEKRQEIIEFRSLETRRRRLEPEEVE